MKKAREEGEIPDKVYAKKGSPYDNAMMTKVFLCDVSRLMRHPETITKDNIGE